MERYGDTVAELKGICTAVADLNARLEYWNRTVPVSFCGNRFEFRAAGSSQYIGFSLAALNTTVAEGLPNLSSMIEGGKSPRDAMAAADHLRRAGVSSIVLEAQRRTERKDKDSPTVRTNRVLDLAEQEGLQNCIHPWRV